MTQRYTKTDVHNIFARFQTIYPKAENWVIQNGSPQNGRAWRLFAKAPEGGLSTVLGANGYLGSTAREAYQALDNIITGIYLAKN